MIKPFPAIPGSLMFAAVLCFLSPDFAHASAPSDAFLEGYVSSILERELGWRRGSYELTVERGIATLTLKGDAVARQGQAIEKLRRIDGLQRLKFVHDEGEPGKTGPVRERVYRMLAVTPQDIALPSGDLFRPLLADPKQPQFFVSIRRYHMPAAINLAAVGYGESFGFYRLDGERRGDGIQISVAGGLFAQFNLDAPSHDLVNADYTIGVPLTYRRGPCSARLRVYHQSSHLGDEYLLRERPARINLSYESLEAIASREWGQWRGYFGGEYLLHREPSDLKRPSLHTGLEYYGSRKYWGRGRWVAGLDLKSFQEHNWSVDSSLKLGLEFGQPGPGGRRMRLMAEGFRGYAPHGQFYNVRISYYGLGLYLGF